MLNGRTLDDGVDNPLLLWLGAPRSQVPDNGLIDLDQPCLLPDDVELVLVDQLVVPGPELPDRLVVLVQEGDVAVPVAVPGVVVALEAEQHVLPSPARRLEVGGPDAVDGVTRPDQVAVVAEDVGAGLAGAVLLGGGVREAGEGRDEEVAVLDVRGGGDGDVEARGREVASGAELPVREGGAEQQGRGEDGPGDHVPHHHAGRLVLASSVSTIVAMLKD